ncbi:MAG: phosphatidylserine decarboxylase [Deltaproteobacteria bacterium]|nr:phosphatidylserine decarboxylase [Deltaproteobacteria bacterium]
MIMPLEMTGRLLNRGFRLLPTNLVSRVWGRFSRTGASRHLIGPYARAFGVTVSEAEMAPSGYPTLNAFFTRRLKPGVRPVDRDPRILVSPVDGKVHACGECDHDRLLQVKGCEYTLFNLLRDGPMARRFIGGGYATLYLSPSDYHRVHAPLDMEVTGIGYMPGVLLPVNPPSIRWNAQLYTHNERVVVYADSPAGKMAVVLVGAHCVGYIALSFHEFVSNRPGVGPTRLHFERSVSLAKGDEVGVFEMGSTVVLLFERDRVDLSLPEMDRPIRLGQRIGALRAGLRNSDDATDL